MEPPKLTPRQQQILDLIQSAIERTGAPPTRAEIAAELGFKSANAAEEHLQALARKGAIEISPGTSRGIRLKGAADPLPVAPAVMMMSLPLVGRVAAGSPILAEENIEEYHQVPPVLGGDEADFMLRVDGDSMKDAGILDGDYVVVQKRDTARDGEIVVAVVGEDEATVKRFYKEADHIRLEPENEAFEPIRSAEVRVEGRVLGVFRRL